jgi:GntR family transcriptional regulator, transcriptional repressor for pyruvate dehydrogenase complex
MPVQPIESRRLYRQIANQLRQLIQSGEYPVGSRLPPERDLASSMVVSRSSVREALIALEVEGLVEVRTSAGIFVVARDAKRPVEDAHGPLELILARQLIEAELAACAASNSDRPLVSRLQAALDSMEDDIARKVLPIVGDRAFHIAIAEASDNSALQSVVAQLFDERNGPLFRQLGHHFERVSTWRAAVAEHRAVLRAIKARDPQAARAAMHDHLQNSHDRFVAVWPTDREPRLAARRGATV